MVLVVRPFINFDSLFYLSFCMYRGIITQHHSARSDLFMGMCHKRMCDMYGTRGTWAHSRVCAKPDRCTWTSKREKGKWYILCFFYPSCSYVFVCISIYPVYNLYITISLYTRMLLFMFSYVLVCYSYVLVCTRMLLLCTRIMLLACTRGVLVTILS